MFKIKTILLIAFTMFVFWPSSSMAKKRINQLDMFINSNLTPTTVYFDLYELEQTKNFRMYYKAGDLLKSTKYPLTLRAEVYVYRDLADKKVFAIFNKTIKSNKSTKNVIFKTQLKFLEDGDRLFVDLYDSNNKLYGTYYHENIDIVDENFSTPASDSVLSSVSELDCPSDNSDPECWI